MRKLAAMLRARGAKPAKQNSVCAMHRLSVAALAAILALLLSACSSPFSSSGSHSVQNQQRPLVIAHRGASGYLPEHTLESAILAYNQGADYIEQDLVLSKDNVPIVLHDTHLERTTDVEFQYPDRARADGRYYAIDFTLAELKRLRVHERENADGSMVFPTRYVGEAHFSLATFEEHIAVIQRLNELHGKRVGIYPEIKSPAWHRAEGKDITKTVLNLLTRYGYTSAKDPVFLQCFDFNEIKRIRNTFNSKLRLIQLIAENSWQESDNDYEYLRSPQGLSDIAAVADGIGPWFGQIIDSGTNQPTGLVSQAQAQGLLVHPYTFRLDQLPHDLTSQQTLDLLFSELKVDGVFTDHAPVIDSYLAAPQRVNTRL